MKKISFCIPTCKNEKDYVSILLDSMEENFKSLEHEIIIFIDSDNQNTYEFLKNRNHKFKDIRILKNKLPVPICYQRNVNLMFENSKHDIVSLLQSDMVVGKNYDSEVLRHLKDDKTIITATRVEPSLHPPSEEKYTQDFGLNPDEFDFNKFNKFVDKNIDLQKTTHFWFAPFTMYKKQWIDIGGHDTLFRRSREDTDILMRFRLKGLNMIQTWSALVYHFTCVSSRGKDWFKEENQERTNLQKLADQLELFKFYKKWKRFDHSATPIEDMSECYLYKTSVVLRNCKMEDRGTIFQIAHHFDKVYIDDDAIVNSIHEQFSDVDGPANILFGYTEEQWKEYSKYFNTFDGISTFEKYREDMTNDDIILHFDLSEINQDRFDFCTQFQTIIHHQIESSGTYDFDIFKVTINNKSPNLIEDNIVVKNPPLKLNEITEEYNG